MRKLAKLLRLEPGDRRLLLSAAAVQTLLRFALALLPFGSVRRLAATFSRTGGRESRADSRLLDRVAWAVITSGQHLPWGRSCLAQALAAQLLLERRGQASELRIGVGRDEDGSFRAHAWIECQGRIVIGEKGSDSLTPLPGLGLEASR